MDPTTYLSFLYHDLVIFFIVISNIVYSAPLHLCTMHHQNEIYFKHLKCCILTCKIFKFKIVNIRYMLGGRLAGLNPLPQAPAPFFKFIQNSSIWSRRQNTKTAFFSLTKSSVIRFDINRWISLHVSVGLNQNSWQNISQFNCLPHFGTWKKLCYRFLLNSRLQH